MDKAEKSRDDGKKDPNHANSGRDKNMHVVEESGRGNMANVSIGGNEKGVNANLNNTNAEDDIEVDCGDVKRKHLGLEEAQQ